MAESVNPSTGGSGGSFEEIFDTIPAEATVSFGGVDYITPHVHSISVRRVRGELSAKANFTFYTQIDEDGQVGSPVTISFYGESIFVGYARRVTVTPSFRCAGEVMVSVQAEDIMYRLVNKRINRRQKLDGLGPIAFITSIHHRPFLGFDDKQALDDVTGGHSPHQLYGPTPAAIKSRFMQGLHNTIGDQHPVMAASDTVLNRGGRGSGAGFFLHDHSSLDISGPHAGGGAKAVYGIK